MADKKFSPIRWTAATEEAAFEGALQVVGVAREDADYEIIERTAKGVTVRIKPRSDASPAATSALAEPATEAADETLAANIGTLGADEPEATKSEDLTPLPFETMAEDDIAIADEMAGEGFLEDEFVPVAADVALEPALEDEAEELQSQFEPESEYDEELRSDFSSREDEDDEFQSRDEFPEEEFAPIDLELVSRAQLTAQDFLDRMGLEATVSPTPDAPSGVLGVTVEGADVGILIGKHGATLQAFQYLLNLTINNGVAPDEGVRVVVDAGNYRARRQSSLEQTARYAAQRARMSGRPVRLDPMPSSERRIVHAFLQVEVGVSTQSEGREPQRRIVVFPAETRQDGTLRSEERPMNDRASGDRAGGRGMGGYNRGRGGRGGRR